MDLAKYQPLFQSAINTWGETSQLSIAIGECGEFLEAIMTCSPANWRNSLSIRQELADVMIMTEQLRVLFGTEAVNLAQAMLPSTDRHEAGQISFCVRQTGKCAGRLIKLVTQHVTQGKATEHQVIDAIASLAHRSQQLRRVLGCHQIDVEIRAKLHRLEGIISGEIDHPHKPVATSVQRASR